MAKKDLRDAKNKVQKIKDDLFSFKQDFNELKQSVRSDKSSLISLKDIGNIDFQQEAKVYLKGLIINEFNGFLGPIIWVRDKIPSDIRNKVSDKIKEKKQATSLESEILAKNKIYRFPVEGSLPGFWLKKFAFKLNDGKKLKIDLSLKNITDNPKLIKKFPSLRINVRGNSINTKIINLSANWNNDREIEINGLIGPYEKPVQYFARTKKFQWMVNKPTITTKIAGTLRREKIALKLTHQLENFTTSIKTPSNSSSLILEKAFNKTEPIKIEASFNGPYRSPALQFKSDTPTSLTGNIKSEIDKKIKKALIQKQREGRRKINLKIKAIENKYEKIQKDLLKSLNIPEINFDQLKESIIKKSNLKQILDKNKIDKNLKKLKKIDLKKLF